MIIFFYKKIYIKLFTYFSFFIVSIIKSYNFKLYLNLITVLFKIDITQFNF